MIPIRSKPDADAIYVDENTRIQILDSILLLGSADKEQCGAFIVSLAFHLLSLFSLLSS